jgi:hypothetical protein
MAKPTTSVGRWSGPSATVGPSHVAHPPISLSQARGDAEPCFVTYLLEHQRDYALSDAELAYLFGSMFGAGSDTVSRGAVAFKLIVDNLVTQTAAAISFTIMAADLRSAD